MAHDGDVMAGCGSNDAMLGTQLPPGVPRPSDRDSGRLAGSVREALADQLGSGGIGAVRAEIAIATAESIDMARSAGDPRLMLAALAQLDKMLGGITDGADRGGSAVADVVGAGPVVGDDQES